jgi:hypothetical protein
VKEPKSTVKVSYFLNEFIIKIKSLFCRMLQACEHSYTPCSMPDAEYTVHWYCKIMSVEEVFLGST